MNDEQLKLDDGGTKSKKHGINGAEVESVMTTDQRRGIQMTESLRRVDD